MNEIVSGIRVIKMYAWEYAFKRVVSKIRRRESVAIFKGLAVRACQQAGMAVAVTVLSLLVFSVYTATGGELTPRKVFTTLLIMYNIRTLFLYGFVLGVLDFHEANVAVLRIQVLILEVIVLLTV